MTGVAIIFAAALPVFKGYEAPRYQQHDALIIRLVREYNANPKVWAGCADGQSVASQLDPAMVKAHMIEESGGNDLLSRAAWVCDPLQVNVPGDWNHYKAYLGLRKPRHRNEGTRENNIRAGIKYLVRKGFGKSGQPAANRPKATFDGWEPALERYNGRSDMMPDGRTYCEVYADKIELRRTDPQRHVPVQIRVR